MLNQVLCVDDDPITLLLYKKVLERFSFCTEIIKSTNGEEALHYFNTLLNNPSTKPDLIFLDLNMPVMGGWEFLEAFTTPKYTDFHTTKIVVLSSSIDPTDLKKAQNYPMVIAFLPKPINKSMLEHLKQILT
ncbi:MULTISPECIES: response regulator [unclassified Flavobacterium]|jgi:CheY-like chemotaxis protein|uniref:response regulator n=1 Tax=unclassified Flavobacterium TaxID=196869 RepID=UPI00131D9F7F|nr:MULTISPECIES: response regulator [unclassified Flavobacterium]